MLINKEGTIVFKGHPAQRPNLVDDFNKLLAGELPDGCTGSAAAGGEVVLPALEGKALNFENVMGEVDTFKNTTAGTLNTQFTEKAKECQRAFCVMVTQAGYDAASDTFLTDYKNYRVLVGKGETVDEMNNWMKDNVKGEFEVVERFHKL